MVPSKPKKTPKTRSRSRRLEEVNLPNDLLIEILKRIPLRPLIQFTCVCKSWHSLLTSPVFIFTHSTFHLSDNTKANPNQQQLLFRESVNVQAESACLGFSIHDINLVDWKILKHGEAISPNPIGRKHFVVGCYNGLVCLFDFYAGDPRYAPLVLWNPSIFRAVFVAPPDDGGRFELTAGGFPKLLFGCGFDSVKNDYVVVRVAYFRGGELGRTLLRGYVYGLSVGKWSLGEGSIDVDFSTIRWRGVCVNEVVHWVGNLNVGVNDKVQRSILTFKLGSELFGGMNLPKELVGATNQTVRVVSVPKGCKEKLGAIHNVASAFRLWVMQDYGIVESWVKLFSVNLDSRLPNDLNVAVLSEKAVMFQSCAGFGELWISYDSISQEMKMYDVPPYFDYVDRYVESLVLLDQRNGVVPGMKLNYLALNRRVASL